MHRPKTSNSDASAEIAAKAAEHADVSGSDGGATFDKQKTMELMERTAMQLIRDNGVLAGLNLREVADRAGVNRGLVYHYFKDRRGLLRSSLRRGAAAVHGIFTDSQVPDPPSVHAADRFRESLRYTERWQTVALLLLDKDDTFPIMPGLGRVSVAFEEGRRAGTVADDLDTRDYAVAMWSMIYGYALLREALARELDLKPATVDRRFELLIGRLFERFDGPTAPSRSAVPTRRRGRRPASDSATRRSGGQ